MAGRRRLRPASLILGGALVLALGACSSGSSNAKSTTTTADQTTTTGRTTGSTTRSSTTSPPGVQNLPVTDELRTQLVAAGAALHHTKPSDYNGLAAGLTYYAYDPATKTYWAGARLDPKSTAEQAQVSSQDEGSYLLFTRTASGSWSATDVGQTGPDTTCAKPPPAAVLAAWQWRPGTCTPPNR
ncbi:MAG: hypothetical protein JO086_16935 [Acidimicrobiia bacterium]|nr:hypothetical protein [Acidimicrobiia bacterium]